MKKLQLMGIVKYICILQLIKFPFWGGPIFQLE